VAPLAETKPCTCGKKMIKRYTNYAWATYPAQYPWDWWCGGCGHTEHGGVAVGKTVEQLQQEAWEQANR